MKKTENRTTRARGMALLIDGELRGFVYAGPYRDQRRKTLGVSLLPDRTVGPRPDVHVPTRDFGTPDPTLARDAAMVVFAAVLEGAPVYVGCTAGLGRTGTFLALLAGLAGAEDPVEYVRAYYDARAVETEKQELFARGLLTRWDKRVARLLAQSRLARRLYLRLFA